MEITPIEGEEGGEEGEEEEKEGGKEGNIKREKQFELKEGWEEEWVLK